MDGIVADTGYLGLKMPTPEQEDNLVKLFQTIADGLHSEGLVFILVEPVKYKKMFFVLETKQNFNKPYHPRSTFESNDFKELFPFVDFFSLMTYDYSTQSPGPLSPLPWMTKTILSLVPPESRASRNVTSKLLLGIPFYGYHYTEGSGQQPLLGPTFIEILNNQKPKKIEWDAENHEHYFSYKEKGSSIQHTIYYPTLAVIIFLF